MNSTINTVINEDRSDAYHCLNQSIQRFCYDLPNSYNKPNVNSFINSILQSKQRPSDSFTHFYAHGECAVFAEAVADSLREHKLSLVVFSSSNQLIHYAVQITIEGTEFYVDAYGATTDINSIINRYSLSSIDSVEIVNLTDSDSKTVQTWRESTFSFMDEFDADELQEVTSLHYSELYEMYILSVIAEHVQCLENI